MEIINGKIVFDTLIAEPGKDLHSEGYVKHGKTPNGGQRWIRKAKRNAYDREKYRLKKEKQLAELEEEQKMEGTVLRGFLPFSLEK